MQANWLFVVCNQSIVMNLSRLAIDFMLIFLVNNCGYATFGFFSALAVCYIPKLRYKFTWQVDHWFNFTGVKWHLRSSNHASLYWILKLDHCVTKRLDGSAKIRENSL